MKIRHTHSPAQKRSLRVRSKIVGTAKKPRISVYRSNRYTLVQAIDDQKGITLAAAHTKQLKQRSKKTKTELAQILGEVLGKSLKAKKIARAIFDRGAYRFHGRVKAVAEGIRQQGIKV